MAHRAGLIDHDYRNDGEHVRVVTSYPHITQEYFTKQGAQAECIVFGGAVELAPMLGLSRYIVDIVTTGRTLAANGLVEKTVITQVSARLIVNRTAYKTRFAFIRELIDSFAKAIDNDN